MSFPEFQTFLPDVRMLHVIWTGLILLTLWLCVMLVTRWGESRVLGKCLLFSILGHCLLGMYATTVMVIHSAAAEEEKQDFVIQRIEIADPTNAREVSSDTLLPNWDRSRNNVAVDSLNMKSSQPARNTRDAPEKPASELATIPSQISNNRSAVSDDRSPEPESAIQAPSERTSATELEDVTPEIAPAATASSPASLSPSGQQLRLRPTENQTLIQRSRTEPSLPLAPGTTDTLQQRAVRQETAIMDSLSPLSITSDPFVDNRQQQDILPAPSASTDVELPRPQKTNHTDFDVTVPSSLSLRQRPSRNAAKASSLPERSAPSVTSRRTLPIGELTDPITRSSPSPVVIPSIQKPEVSFSGEPVDQLRSPSIYQLRVVADRMKTALSHGASVESEQAVEDALHWFTQHQHADGHWDADRFSDHCPGEDICTGAAGTEGLVDGQDRTQAGKNADTAITALTVLGFLGAGYTHQQGPYTQIVNRALAWLIGQQKPNGHLGGQANLFASMYAHAMATIALGEAFGMTHDKGLEKSVVLAINYIIDNQEPRSGGWRYKNGQSGDTSMMGWQLMALRSAEYAGVEVPARTWRGARRFLKSVTRGTHKGLASYRPREAITPSMTAEALFCRQLLGNTPNSLSSQESVTYLLQNLPDQGPYNLYYWYYATLSLFQHGDNPWKTWNGHLRDMLLARQETDGHALGSWPAQSIWAGHGGRIYSTAMSLLCLEVYYRYLPMYETLAGPTPIASE